MVLLGQPRRGQVRRSVHCSTSAATRTRTPVSVAAARTSVWAPTSRVARSASSSRSYTARFPTSPRQRNLVDCCRRSSTGSSGYRCPGHHRAELTRGTTGIVELTAVVVVQPPAGQDRHGRRTESSGSIQSASAGIAATAASKTESCLSRCKRRSAPSVDKRDSERVVVVQEHHPRLRAAPAMRPARPDASMTRAASSTSAPISDSGGTCSLNHHLGHVPRDHAYPWFSGGTAPQFALEHHSAATQRGGSTVGTRCHHRRGACRDQSGQHVGHFIIQRVDHLPTKAVGVLKPASLPCVFHSAWTGGPGSR